MYMNIYIYIYIIIYIHMYMYVEYHMFYVLATLNTIYHILYTFTTYYIHCLFATHMTQLQIDRHHLYVLYALPYSTCVPLIWMHWLSYIPHTAYATPFTNPHPQGEGGYHDHGWGRGPEPGTYTVYHYYPLFTFNASL